MTKTCKLCGRTNPDSAHYCTECGKPLETEGYFSYKKDKLYIVVSKTEYENNKKELERYRSKDNKNSSDLMNLAELLPAE